MDSIVVWIPTLTLILISVVIFAARHRIQAGIEKSVQHKFDSKIEALRTELRNREEEFKSQLRLRETEISTLREGVLGGRANRQALLDKRRLDAVDKVWTTVQALAPFEMLSGMMAAFKIDAMAKRAPTDPKIRQLFELLGSTIGKLPSQPLAASYEEPFVSPVAWAYFSAYQAVVFSAYAQAKALEFSLKDSDELLNVEHIKKLLKVALPHQAQFIDKYDRGAYHYLLDELKRALLSELRKMLEGADVDQASITRSVNIMKAVNEVVKDREMTLATAVGLA